MKKRIIVDLEYVIKKINEKDLVDLKPIFPELKKLKPRNKQSNQFYSLIMLCPFHKENNPSFEWLPRKGFWHCFGCGNHGQIINYYIERKGVPLFPAVIALAKFFKIKIFWKNIYIQRS